MVGGSENIWPGSPLLSKSSASLFNHPSVKLEAHIKNWTRLCTRFISTRTIFKCFASLTCDFQAMYKHDRFRVAYTWNLISLRSPTNGHECVPGFSLSVASSRI